MPVECLSYLVGVAPSCAYVSVSGLAAPGADQYKKYVIVSGRPDVSTNDLEFVEYSTQLARSLEGRGYEQVANADSAEITISLTYGISDPKQSIYSTTRTDSNDNSYASINTSTSYTRKATISAADKAGVEKWRNTVSSTGSSGDLSKLFPVLVFAASQHYAVNTGDAKVVQIPFSDKNVKYIATGIKSGK